ncbi:MAG: aminotransferase class V-fold PLP-dependent enzyme [Candidatus Paceibacterota bacterium]
MLKVISISLSPNTERDDILLALGLILSPWQWKKGGATQELQKAFQEKFDFGQCFSFNSGRSCLLAALDAIGAGRGNEIIIQSFTCNAVVNPILKFGAKPVYVDIGHDLNIDINKIEEKITPKTKAIIAQHTFGMPCDIEAIIALCKKHNLILIEDCAHALGAKINNKYCGSFGDLSFFSFGRDKVISSVYGGMLCVNNRNLLENVKNFQSQTAYPKGAWTFQQLLHPVLVNLLILPFYNILLGKIIMALAINLGILSKAVTKNENQGVLPAYFPSRLPNALSILALNQLRKLDRFNRHRQEMAAFYAKELADNPDYEIVFKNIPPNKNPIYLKYPLINKNSKNIIDRMKESNIYLNDGWRDSAIMPLATILEKMAYSEGSCRLAEEISKKIIYLPTHANISINDAKKIAYLLKN